MKTQFQMQFKPAVSTRHKNSKASKTVPGQSYTIPEIMKRSAAGLSVSGNMAVPLYKEDDDIFEGRDPRTLDLSEKYDMLRTAERNYRELVEKHEHDQEEARIARLREEHRKQFQAEIEAENSLKNDSPVA